MRENEYEHLYPCDDPMHDRCNRTLAGDPTCSSGHALRDDGFCETCDALPEGITVGMMLEALMRKGCAPRRVGPRPSLKLTGKRAETDSHLHLVKDEGGDED
jgi:hypothetical protein